jgi:hypothetical protein
MDFIIRERREIRNRGGKAKKNKCLEAIKDLETMTSDLATNYRIIEDRVDAFQVQLSKHIDFDADISFNNPTPVDQLPSFIKSGSTKPSESVSCSLTNLLSKKSPLFDKLDIHNEIYRKERKQWYVIRKMRGEDEYKKAYKNAYQRLYYIHITKPSLV